MWCSKAWLWVILLLHMSSASSWRMPSHMHLVSAALKRVFFPWLEHMHRDGELVDSLENDNVDAFFAAIKRGARLNLVAPNGFQLIHLACICENLAILKYLVEHGASLYTQTTDGDLPLLVACCSQSPALVRFFVKKGVSLLLQGQNKLTCLHYAAIGGDLRIIRYIMHATKFSINRGDFYRVTPLHHALFNSCYHAAFYLLCLGADETISDHWGDKPFDCVKKRDCNFKLFEKVYLHYKKLKNVQVMLDNKKTYTDLENFFEKRPENFRFFLLEMCRNPFKPLACLLKFSQNRVMKTVLHDFVLPGNAWKMMQTKKGKERSDTRFVFS